MYLSKQITSTRINHFCSGMFRLLPVLGLSLSSVFMNWSISFFPSFGYYFGHGFDLDKNGWGALLRNVMFLHLIFLFQKDLLDLRERYIQREEKGTSYGARGPHPKANQLQKDSLPNWNNSQKMVITKDVYPSSIFDMISRWYATPWSNS